MRRSPLFLIWLTVFIDLLGFGIIIPILPFYARSHGASPAMLGVLLGSYSAAQFVFAPILGSLSDRVGRKPVLAASLLGTSAASLLLGVASGYPSALWLLFAARILDGVTGANVATAQAYVADVTKPEQRARGMGLIGMALGLGFVLGPAVGGVLVGFGPAVPFYVVAALAFGNAVAMLFRLPEPERHLSVATDARARFSRLSAALRAPETGILLVVVLLSTVAFAGMESTLAFLLSDRYALDQQQVGFAFAFVGVVMAAVQGGLVGKLTERVGERPLITFGVLALALALGLLGLPLGPSLALLGGALALLAIGAGLYNPAVSGLVSRLTPRASQGATLGVTQSMQSLGRVAGPVVGGALYGFGWPLPYYFGAAVMAICLLLSLYYNATVSPAVPARS